VSTDTIIHPATTQAEMVKMTKITRCRMHTAPFEKDNTVLIKVQVVCIQSKQRVMKQNYIYDSEWPT